jgi:hypothetical protein
MKLVRAIIGSALAAALAVTLLLGALRDWGHYLHELPAALVVLLLFVALPLAALNAGIRKTKLNAYATYAIAGATLEIVYLLVPMFWHGAILSAALKPFIVCFGISGAIAGVVFRWLAGRGETTPSPNVGPTSTAAVGLRRDGP